MRVREEGEGIAVASGSIAVRPPEYRATERSDRRRRERQEELALLGATLSSLDTAEAAAWLVRQAATRRAEPVIVTHANAHNLHVLRRRSVLLGALAERGQLLLEGIGMKTVALATRGGWRRDTNGTDMAALVLARCARFGIPVYLFGGTPTVMVRAVQRLRRRYPELRIAGARHGYLGRRAEARVVQKIRASGAALLIQGRGCPRQEEFALRWARQLGVSVVWNVGGLFDFLAGVRPRAPRWVRRARLEWLFRLALEPRRLARRSLVSFPMLLATALRARYRGGRTRA